MTQGFHNSRGHTAVDLANGTEGDVVRAIGPGVVALCLPESQSSGFGNVILIKHDPPDDAYFSLYAHLQNGSVDCASLNRVSAGDPIARVDCTGKSEGSTPCPSNGGTGSHLHFAVKRKGQIGCAYVSAGTCRNSGETFKDYVDPIKFVADRLQPAISTAFTLGDRVEVSSAANPNVNVRDAANGNVLGAQTPGTQGIVVGGPLWGGGYWWWQVDFDNGVDGWVSENYLRGPSSPPPPPPPGPPPPTPIPCTPLFVDDFNRPESNEVGNGWSTVPESVSDLRILNNEVSQVNGFTGMLRPVSPFVSPITMSATLKEMNGYNGLLRRYASALCILNNSPLGLGYCVMFSRGDENYQDSAITLFDGDYETSIASTFQYGPQIQVRVTFSPDGSVTGTVSGDNNESTFSFGPRTILSRGDNLAYFTEGPDTRATELTHPRLDDFAFTTTCP